MSKSARKHRPVKKLHKPHHEPKPAPKFNFKSPMVPIIVTAILAAIPFAMGKYIEFNSPDAFDSGCYVYSARHILDGATIGIDEKPSAKMGTLLINMLGVRLFGFNETGPKLMQMLLQAAAFVLMFITMRKLFGTLAASIGVIVASIYLSAPLIAKFGNVKEQHMIAFMIMGMSCFVLYQLNGKWWCAIPAGAFLSFAPLFKETGTSALGTVGLFLILQPVLKHNSWKKTGVDILWLVTGATAIVIIPISLWLTVQKAPVNYYPYSFLYRPFLAAHKAPEAGTEKEQTEPASVTAETEKSAVEQGLIMKLLPGYVRDSWQALDPKGRKEVRLRVFRYYRLLILPIALALGAIILRITRLIFGRKIKGDRDIGSDRFVLLFAVWWLLDMSFVWISPRLYEQYFLPLNASAAMLGGYLIAAYSDKAKKATSKPAWIAVGAASLLVMMVMSLHIFRGVLRSPHSNVIHLNPNTKQPERYRGFSQRLGDAKAHRNGSSIGPWEQAGQYIREHSQPGDGIYVWGWFPGIYISAQRFSPAPKAFEGTMTILSPKVLSERIDEILNSFKDKPPKFIVDSRKDHFPWDRPPLELWPSIQNGIRLIKPTPTDRNQLLFALLRTFDVKSDDLTRDGFLRSDKPEGINRYDAAFEKALRTEIDSDEAQRYVVMKPFRNYVMNNYTIVQTFGQHVLFQRK